MMNDNNHTATWMLLGAATLFFFLGAAIYNFRPTFLTGESSVYAAICGGNIFLLAAIPRMSKLLATAPHPIVRMEGIGMLGCIISSVGFALAYVEDDTLMADYALVGFYFIGVWMVALNIYGFWRAPWPKAVSCVGIAAAIPLGILAVGSHSSDSDVMAIGAVLSMGLMPLWLAGLTAWLIFHDTRLRAMANIREESL